MLWVIFVLLLVVTLGALLYPLFRGEDTIVSRERFDANIYKDQLRAIDRELDEGQIDEEDAENARIEISRKLLASNEKAEKQPTLSASGRELSQTAAVVLALAVPAAAFGLYGRMGSPDLPDLPLEARLHQNPMQSRIAMLIRRAEERLAKYPNDARGWEIMAPVYLRNEMYGKAKRAYENTIRLNGASAKRMAGLAEATILDNGGIVGDDVLPVLRQAIKMDGDLPKPHFWMGLYYEQTGKLGKADRTYSTLLKETPENLSWRKMVQARLDGVRTRLGLPVVRIAGIKTVQKPDIPLGDALAGRGRLASGTGMPGPSAADIRAAGKMSAADRRAMINAMVERLANRLKTQGGDANAWLRLANAYMVQGKKARALEAIALGKKNVAKDANGVARLEAMRQKINGSQIASETGRAPMMPGPSAADIRAAGKMSVADRQAMVNNMVSRLANRLKKQGGDIQSWMRLVRAYNVLGKKAEARKALQAGKKNLHKDRRAVARLEALAQQLGLGS